jgi:hypothetical protein
VSYGTMERAVFWYALFMGLFRPSGYRLTPQFRGASTGQSRNCGSHMPGSMVRVPPFPPITQFFTRVLDLSQSERIQNKSIASPTQAISDRWSSSQPFALPVIHCT